MLGQTKAIWRGPNSTRRFKILRRPALEWLHQWGYPRPLALVELEPTTRWIALGDDFVFWYLLTDDSCWIHVCAKPGAHFVTDVRRWHAVLEFLAQVSGAKRLRANPGCGPEGEVAGYLRRLGWVPDPEAGEGALQRWV